MAGLLGRYNAWNKRVPFIAIPVSTACVLASGDVMCQGLELSGKIPKPKLNEGEAEKTSLDPVRALRMGIYGGCCLGPMAAFWYTRFLPWAVPMDKPALVPVLKKVFLDETLLSWYYYTSFPLCMTVLEGGSLIEAKNQMIRDFWVLWTTDLMFWPWIQFVNFWFVPIHLQALVLSTVSVPWGAFLSSVQNS